MGIGVIHDVYDTDTRFTINPVTRMVKNESSKKITLIQYDHNSEVFGFEIPRFIEGHDLSLCNKVEIHYINVSSETKNENKGLYEVKDLQIDTENEEKVVFSWLLTQNCTKYVGSLAFLVMFKCEVDGDITYRWSTSINKDMVISKGIDNGNEIVETYPDILAQWKSDIDEMIGTSVNELSELIGGDA